MIDAIRREMSFAAPIEKVWEAISNPTEVQKWFGSAAHFELIEGEIGYFEWQEECEGRFAMRVEAVTPCTYLAWRWMHNQDDPFNAQTSTLVEWQLTSTPKGGTTLVLTESGFAATKHREQNVEGWDQELADLAQYVDL